MNTEAKTISVESVQQKSTSKAGKILNGVFILLIIFGFGDIIYSNRNELGSYKDVLLNINYVYLILVLAISVFAAIMRSWRWYYLLLPIKNRLSKLNVLRVNINALAANYSMPGKLGVPVKAILLKKTENIPVSQSLPSIFGEIFIEHSSELVLSIICIIVGGHLAKFWNFSTQLVQQRSILVNFLIILVIVVAIVILFVLFRKFKSMNFFHKIIEAIQLTRKRKDYLGYSYLISAVNILISYIGVWFVFAALGHPEVSYTFIVFAGSVTNFISLISPMPGGLGVRELTFYGLYDLYFGLGGIAFLAIVLIRLLTYLALFLLFLIEKMYSHYRNTAKEITV